MSKTKPSPKRKPQTLRADLWKISVLESLRYLFFFAFVAGLGAAIYGSPFLPLPQGLRARITRLFPAPGHEPGQQAHESFKKNRLGFLPLAELLEKKDRG